MMDACDEPDCEATLKELDVFLDNELSDEARHSITHHLEGCPDCHGAFDFHAELKQVIGEKCRNEEMPHRSARTHRAVFRDRLRQRRPDRLRPTILRDR